MKFEKLLPLPRPGSRLCTAEEFLDPWYGYWAALMHEPPRHHRKQWEFVFILNALARHGMLEPGKSGMGFGVGREPLPALFASFGCEVLATDQAQTQAGAWAKTAQHAESLASLNERGICTPEAFQRLVSFLPVDMNDLPPLGPGFDFCWSACALEHLGNLMAGLQFIEGSLELLKAGGVAVHTTEFNVSSNDDTIAAGGTVLYRRQDIEALADWLTKAGHEVEELDFNPGSSPLDQYIDLPPYQSSPHLKLQIGKYECTSIGLVVRKKK